MPASGLEAAVRPVNDGGSVESFPKRPIEEFIGPIRTVEDDIGPTVLS